MFGVGAEPPGVAATLLWSICRLSNFRPRRRLTGDACGAQVDGAAVHPEVASTMEASGVKPVDVDAVTGSVLVVVTPVVAVTTAKLVATVFDGSAAKSSRQDFALRSLLGGEDSKGFLKL